jgi:2-oxoglutarate ferredoxin oxidoreductase subunit beta
MHDGSSIRLHKLNKDWDPLDRLSAMNAVQRAKQKGEILTGLLYLNESSMDLHEVLKTTDKPLNSLGRDKLCPGNSVLESINKALR